MKTFWLSFADSERGGFLGVAIVQVDAADAEDARELLLPQSKPGAEWLIAAIRRAREMGCNPGGEVLSSELPAPPPGVRLNRLLNEADALAAQRAVQRAPAAQLRVVTRKTHKRLRSRRKKGGQ